MPIEAMACNEAARIRLSTAGLPTADLSAAGTGGGLQLFGLRDKGRLIGVAGGWSPAPIAETAQSKGLCPAASAFMAKDMGFF